MNPFVVDDAIIYTNGHVMAIAPFEPGHVAYGGDRINKNNMQKMIADARSRQYAPVPTVTMPLKVYCRVCSGIGKATTKNCSECNGDGEIEFDTDYNTYECECKTCAGNGTEIIVGGEVDCEECSGSGKVYDLATPVLIDGVAINPAYFELVNELPDVQYSASDTRDRLYFKSGAIFGIVMGIKV